MEEKNNIQIAIEAFGHRHPEIKLEKSTRRAELDTLAESPQSFRLLHVDHLDDVVADRRGVGFRLIAQQLHHLGGEDGGFHRLDP